MNPIHPGGRAYERQTRAAEERTGLDNPCAQATEGRCTGDTKRELGGPDAAADTGSTRSSTRNGAERYMTVLSL